MRHVVFWFYVTGLLFSYIVNANPPEETLGFSQVLVTADAEGHTHSARIDIGINLSARDIGVISHPSEVIKDVEVFIAVPRDLNSSDVELLKHKIENETGNDHIKVATFPIDVEAVVKQLAAANISLQTTDLPITAEAKNAAIQLNLESSRSILTWRATFAEQIRKLTPEQKNFFYARLVPSARGSAVATTWIVIAGITPYTVVLGTIDVVLEFWNALNDHKYDAMSTSWTKKLGRLSRTAIIKKLDAYDVLKASIFGMALFGTGYRFVQRAVGSVVDYATNGTNQTEFHDPSHWIKVLSTGGVTWVTRAMWRIGLGNLVAKGYLSTDGQRLINFASMLYYQSLAVSLITNHIDTLLVIGSIGSIGQAGLYKLSLSLPSRALSINVPAVGDDENAEKIENMITAEVNSGKDLETAALEVHKRSGLNKYIQRSKEQIANGMKKLSGMVNGCQSTFY